MLPYSGVMFEMHVRCVALKAPSGAEALHEAAHHALGAQHLGNVSATSMAMTPSPSSPVRRTPTTFGTSVVMGWPSAAASASMPPTPQPSTPMPLAVGVWLSVPTSVSKYATVSLGAPSAVMATWANCSMFS